MREKASLSQIVADLKQHCQAGHTGKFWILGNKNSAYFALDQGRIVIIQLANKQGQEALEGVANIKEGVTNFLKGIQWQPPSIPLPSNEEIFQCLSGQGGASVFPSEASGNQLTPADKTLLEDLLVEQIGPMAQIICSSVLSSVADTEAAVAALARKIPDTGSREQFLAKARAKI